MKAVISGSFNKHFDTIIRAAQALHDIGVDVLAPKVSAIINPGEDFLFLATDNKEKSPYELEIEFMENISKADFLYVIDPDGYKGESVTAEISHAHVCGVPVILLHENMSIENISRETIEKMLELKQRSFTPEEIEKFSKIKESLVEKLKHLKNV